MNSPIAGSNKKFPVVACLAIAGSLFVLAAIVVVLFGNPTVALDLQLDGKPLPIGVIPLVTMNGKPFHSGEKVDLGHNSLSIILKDTDPINLSLWTFWGTDNLGSLTLKTFKGNLSLTTTPPAATFALRKGRDSIHSGIAPATLNDIPVGDYDVLVSRGSYKESRAVTITKGETTALDLNLKIADILLESSPPDAIFTLIGNGNKWDGKLPTVISNATFGNYTLTSSRKGWDIVSSITVDKTGGLTNQTEFPYASIAVTSKPDGLPISSEGSELGKTPVTLNLKPGTYALTISDGENDLTTSISIGPNEKAKHDFAFHYGSVKLLSQPVGATVTRKGKEIGKTPLMLDRILVGESSVTLSLAGYGSTNLTISAIENAPANFQVKLMSERYLQAMKDAHEALNAAHFSESQKFIAAALESEPNDPAAIKLRNETSAAAIKAEKVLQAEQANTKAREMVSLATLDFERAMVGNTYKFDSTGWKIVKIEKDGTIVFRSSGSRNSLEFGQVEIRATPLAANQGEFLSVNTSQRITIKALVKSRDQGDLFSRVLQRINLENAEILEK